MFVGLSRAKDRLVVSRAKKYGGASRPRASKLLDPLLPILAPQGEPDSRWTDPGPATPSFAAQLAAQTLGEVLAVTALEDYLACPRRYYYGEALGLSRKLADTPFLRFHDVVRTGVAWLRERDGQGGAELAAHLAESWSARGPTDHPAAAHYKGAAERMLIRARTMMIGRPLPTERRLLIEGVAVTARADHIQAIAGGIVIQRLKAGRLARTGETPRARYALLQAMVTQDEGGAITFTHVSLVDGDERDATLSADKLRKALDEAKGALAGIAASRFDPNPVRSAKNCPTCPFFFICPADGLIYD